MLTSNTCLPASASRKATAAESEVLPTPPLPVQRRKRVGSRYRSSDIAMVSDGVMAAAWGMRTISP